LHFFVACALMGSNTAATFAPLLVAAGDVVTFELQRASGVSGALQCACATTSKPSHVCNNKHSIITMVALPRFAARAVNMRKLHDSLFSPNWHTHSGHMPQRLKT
jgi:hypothetical protein